MGDKFEQTDRFVQGLKIRKEVLGDAYVDKALEGVCQDRDRDCWLLTVLTDQQPTAKVPSTIHNRGME